MATKEFTVRTIEYNVNLDAYNLTLVGGQGFDPAFELAGKVTVNPIKENNVSVHTDRAMAEMKKVAAKHGFSLLCADLKDNVYYPTSMFYSADNEQCMLCRIPESNTFYMVCLNDGRMVRCSGGRISYQSVEHGRKYMTEAELINNWRVAQTSINAGTAERAVRG